MDSKDDLSKDDQFIPMIEPIVEIKEEEKCFIVPTVVDKVSIKEELCDNEEISNSSSSNV